MPRAPPVIRTVESGPSSTVGVVLRERTGIDLPGHAAIAGAADLERPVRVAEFGEQLLRECGAGDSGSISTTRTVTSGHSWPRHLVNPATPPCPAEKSAGRSLPKPIVPPIAVTASRTAGAVLARSRGCRSPARGRAGRATSPRDRIARSRRFAFGRFGQRQQVDQARDGAALRANRASRSATASGSVRSAAAEWLARCRMANQDGLHVEFAEPVGEFLRGALAGRR